MDADTTKNPFGDAKKDGDAPADDAVPAAFGAESEEPALDEPADDDSYETPEQAIEKVMSASSPEEALEELKRCGYELKPTKMEPVDEPVEPFHTRMARMRGSVAKKLAGEGN